MSKAKAKVLEVYPALLLILSPYHFQVRGLSRGSAAGATPMAEDEGPLDIDVGTEAPPLDPHGPHHGHPPHLY